MLIGIAIGAGFIIGLVLAFMVGYGIADQKHNPSKTEEE
jgi:hypothetical protein